MINSILSIIGNVDIVMLLLQHGAQVDATTKDLYSSLHIASKEGQDEVRDLIAKKIMDHIDTIYSMQLFWIRHKEFFIWLLFIRKNEAKARKSKRNLFFFILFYFNSEIIR